ncbi:MAG: hypothetical protein GKS02_03335 [Alphaproteobacteria bacterium]|nr:hypothetical protein [Alphaproteobacteria bacterium]
MRHRLLATIAITAALLLWPGGGAFAAEEVFRDDRFIIIDEGDHGAARIAYVRDELYRGIEALDHLGVDIDDAPYPITVRARPGRGLSHINRRGEIVLYRLRQDRAPILHELTHVVAGYDRSKGHWSQEGFASFVQDSFGGNNAYPTYKQPEDLARIIFSKDEMLPMADVMADRNRQKYFGKQDAWRRWQAYAQSSAFVGYLIGKYGTTPFHAIYNRAVEDMDFDDAFGQPKDKLIADWIETLFGQSEPSAEGQRIYQLLNKNLK